MTKIIPGKTTFRHTHADSNALWLVQRSRGHGLWECIISEEDLDYAGVTRVFNAEEIVRAVKSGQLWERLRSETEDFWKARKPGEIFHCANSRDQFIRAEVVADPDKGFVLRPVALVGNWRSQELPRWWDSGHFTDGGYWVKKVREGETFQPNESSLWEVQKNGRADDGVDPSTLPVVDISTPVPTPAQREAADMLAVVSEVQELLDMPRQSADFAETYRERLAAVAALITARIDPDHTVPPSTPRPRMG
ncbi:hypothetical protein GOB57_22330 [Sinorhizobium meliloti]|nr:hypothetical protein [Sinorhizobium meliloti]